MIAIVCFVPFANMARWRAKEPSHTWRPPFLLDREPKESILEDFDVKVISRYSPNLSKSCELSLAILTSGVVPIGRRAGGG